MLFQGFLLTLGGRWTWSYLWKSCWLLNSDTTNWIVDKITWSHDYLCRCSCLAWRQTNMQIVDSKGIINYRMHLEGWWKVVVRCARSHRCKQFEIAICLQEQLTCLFCRIYGLWRWAVWALLVRISMLERKTLLGKEARKIGYYRLLGYMTHYQTSSVLDWSQNDNAQEPDSFRSECCQRLSHYHTTGTCMVTIMMCVVP